MANTVVTKSGRRLTEADIERLAAEAERGFDLSTWKHRRGRPPLDANSDTHAPRIAIRLPTALHRRVATQAAAEGRSVSALVRSLLEEYVRRSTPPSTRG